MNTTIQIPDNITVREMSRHLDWEPLQKDEFASPRFAFQVMIQGPGGMMLSPYSGGCLAFLDEAAKKRLRLGKLQGPGNPHTGAQFAAYFAAGGSRRYKAHPDGTCHVRDGYSLMLAASKVDPVSVIYSLYRDSEALNYARYEDWASEFGFDEDSREGERTYRLCQELGAQFKKVVGQENFDSFEALFEDY